MSRMMDKRRHKRVPLAASATIRYNSEGSSEPIQAMTADISLSGIGIYSDKPIREGTGLSIEITFFSTEDVTMTVSLQGESVYAREMGGEMGGMYFVGIEFDEEINPIQQPSLHHHLQKILSWS